MLLWPRVEAAVRVAGHLEPAVPAQAAGVLEHPIQVRSSTAEAIKRGTHSPPMNRLIADLAWETSAGELAQHQTACQSALPALGSVHPNSRMIPGATNLGKDSLRAEQLLPVPLRPLNQISAALGRSNTCCAIRRMPPRAVRMPRSWPWAVSSVRGV